MQTHAKSRRSGSCGSKAIVLCQGPAFCGASKGLSAEKPEPVDLARFKPKYKDVGRNRFVDVQLRQVPAPKPQEHYSALGIGPDQRVYFGTCNESGFAVLSMIRGHQSQPWKTLTSEQKTHFATMGAHLYAYDPKSDAWEDIADVHKLSGELGRGTFPHTKVHTQICACNGNVYFGSDCTYWIEQSYIEYPEAYPGGHLFEYDPKSGKVTDLGILIPHESLKTMGVDAKRKKLYILSHPSNHFLIYDLRTRKLTDRAVIEVWSRVTRGIAVIPDGRVYTTNTKGEIVRYSPDTDEFETLTTANVGGAPEQIAVGFDGKKLYMGTATGLLYEYAVDDGHEGKVKILGPSYGIRKDGKMLAGFCNGVYGITTRQDGSIYYCGYWGKSAGEMWCYDPKTDTFEFIGRLQVDDKPIKVYCCSAATAPDGTMYFGGIMNMCDYIWSYRP